MSCMTLDSQFLSQVLERLKSQVTFNLPPCSRWHHTGTIAIGDEQQRSSISCNPTFREIIRDFVIAQFPIRAESRVS